MVSTPKVSTVGIHASSLETRMLPDNFDPFFRRVGNQAPRLHATATAEG